MGEERLRYETRTVKTVRGMEARTAAKWEREGWEVVSQTQRRVQSELQIRRLVPKRSWRTWAIGGGAAAAVAAVVALGVTGVFADDGGGTETVATGPRMPAETPGEENSPSATKSSSSRSENVVISAASNPELAALLQLGDYCDAAINRFAATYDGRSIMFDGSVAAMSPHGNYKTRYDMLIGAGNFSVTAARGPAFQFTDVNTVSDLHYAGNVPDAIGVGTNLTVTATVGDYNPTTCLFQLQPVKTELR